jgi:hypothetical protein
MRNMNCRNICREIEEVGSDHLLSSSAKDHIENCLECKAFSEDRLKLREMLSSLGAVTAPDDFDFRLRARLANEKRGGADPFVMRTMSFGLRSAAFATILLLIGAAFLFVRFSGPADSSLSAKDTKPSSTTVDKPAINQAGNGYQPAPPVIAGVQIGQPRTGETNLNPVSLHDQRAAKRHGGGARNEVASLRDTPRVKTRDLSSTAAPIFRPTDAIAANGSSVFPIGASYQSLRVLLDDGRGSSRTISLPSVSFGSQRVLAQGSSPLLASARSAW